MVIPLMMSSSAVTRQVAAMTEVSLGYADPVARGVADDDDQPMQLPPTPDESGGEAPEVLMVSKVRVVEFIDEILKSSSGKIVRRVLVERDRAAIPST